MKTALMALIALSSFNAFATSAQTYRVGEPAVITSQYKVSEADVAYCPKFDSLVVTQDKNLNGTSLVFDYQGDIVATKPTGPSTTCMSDVVCPTDDTFDFVNGNGYASLMRNNDGEYPTKDLPGYAGLSVLVDAPTATGKVACYYRITNLN